jgi:hypothetical protein
VLLHLTFNVSDGVLLSGLPDQAASALRRMYLASVGLILVAGVVALACLTLRRGRPDEEDPIGCAASP